MPLFKYLKSSKPGNREKFTNYFKTNTFGSEGSVSGEGSTLEQTAVIRNRIPKLISKYNIKSFVDAPCGDFNWMRYTDLSKVDFYRGLDIVKELIENNNKKFKTNTVSFEVRDICKDELPVADLILCRDCLVHLLYSDALKAIRNFKKATIQYLLVTTFSERNTNTDLGAGIWRPLNMQLPPFNFPEPLELINEACTEGENLFTDKCLALYKLSDIRIG